MVDETPWSKYKASDYTVEQWCKACLIHQHEGDATSKDQCKLPVLTPSGEVNRNAVYSAAAALGGARGGVDATEAEKAKASTELLRLYKELKTPPPINLIRHSDADDSISHFGIKGMKWGVRRSNDVLDANARRRGDLPPKDDNGRFRHDPKHVAVDAERAAKTVAKGDTASMSTQEMKDVVNRAKTLREYRQFFEADNSAVAQQIERLKLEQEMLRLEALRPEQKTRIQRFLGTAQTGFDNFQKLDSMMGGAMSAGLTKKMGLVEKPTDLEKLDNHLKILAKGKEIRTMQNSIADLRQETIERRERHDAADRGRAERAQAEASRQRQNAIIRDMSDARIEQRKKFEREQKERESLLGEAEGMISDLTKVNRSLTKILKGSR